MKTTRLKRSKADSCIYFNLEKGIILGVYVDDTILIAKNDQILENFVEEVGVRNI